MDELEEWQNRPLKKFYTFLFVDCMYVTIHKDYETKNCAVYTILGYDIDGQKIYSVYGLMRAKVNMYGCRSLMN